jgi:hypothetical protein
MSCDEAETSPGYSMSCDEAVTSPVTQQGLNKNSITRHHVPSIVNAICAGQGPFRGYRCRSQSRQVRVYTAVVVGSSPAGPTSITGITAIPLRAPSGEASAGHWCQFSLRRQVAPDDRG